jgi:multisubunit Na+/H+ antiporter MnhC subunit
MELWLTLAIGVLFATGTYLVLRRRLLKVVIGFALISHGYARAQCVCCAGAASPCNGSSAWSQP